MMTIKEATQLFDPPMSINGIRNWTTKGIRSVAGDLIILAHQKNAKNPRAAVMIPDGAIEDFFQRLHESNLRALKKNQ